MVDDTISNYDLLDLLKDPVFILDGTTYLFVNQAAAELLGYEDSKELIGIPAFQHVAPSSRELSRSFAKARQNGENVPDRYTMQLIDKHGKHIDVEAHVSSIIFDGKPASLAVNHDLSEITKFTKQLASFHQYSVELASMSEIQEIADKTIEIIVDSLGYGLAAFGIIDENDLNYVSGQGEGFQPFKIPLDGPSIANRAIRTGQSQLVNNVKEDPDFYPGPELDIFAIMSELHVPVIVDDETRAVLSVVKASPYSFTERDRIVVEVFANYVASSLKILDYKRNLKETEETYKPMLENANDAIIVQDKDTKIVFANVSAAELVGLSSPEELIGQTPLKFVHPDAREELVETANGRRQGAPRNRYESTLVGVDGQTRDVEFNVSTVSWRGELGYLSVVRDITDLKKYEKQLEALHTQAQRLTALNSVQQVIEVSLDILQELSGYDLLAFQQLEGDELKVKAFRGFQPSPVPLNIQGPGISVLSVKEKRLINVPDVNENPYYVKSKGIEIRSEIVCPVLIGTDVYGVINIESKQLDAFDKNIERLLELIALHVSSAIHRVQLVETQRETQQQLFEEKIRTEQARELDRIKTNFMNTAAHEIRTPVTSISGYSELIKDQLDDKTDPELVLYLNTILRNISRLEHLTNDLLDMQRIETGLMNIQKSAVRIASLIQQLEMEISPIIDRKNQTLEIFIESGDRVIECDELRILQVLVNLVNNASRYSPPGSAVTLKVSSTDDHIEFTVSDEGVGVSSDDFEKLFTPFPDIQVKEVTHGTGLGLSISKGIVEIHGGKIWAKSDDPGKGSTFTFTLPAH